MPDQPLGTRPALRGEIVEGVPRAASPLEVLDLVSYVMDRCVEVPGTNIRVGLNALLPFLPVLGDIIPAMVSLGILLVGLNHYRVPRIVAARMVLNSLLDIALGWIPLFGDLFDVWFKADTRNVRLLQEYAGTSGPPPRATWRHWLFVVGVVGAAVVIVVLLVLAAAALIEWVVRLIRGGA
jgi:Domain of unknown function (DUF4112)